MSAKICSACGEKNNPSFKSCWKCGSDFETGLVLESFKPSRSSRSNAAGAFGGFLYLLYMLMGLFQLAAILGGIEKWWGWPWWIAIFIAFPISYIPILGTLVGIMGAIKAFGWSAPLSVLLFCWPYALYLVFILFFGAASLFSRSRK